MRYPKLVTTTLLCVVTSWCILPAARADEASEYLAAAKDEVDAFADCTTAFARPLVKSSEAPEQIADDATNACEAKLGAVRVALLGEPTRLSDAKATEVVGQLREQSRTNLAGLIRKARE